VSSGGFWPDDGGSTEAPETDIGSTEPPETDIGSTEPPPERANGHEPEAALEAQEEEAAAAAVEAEPGAEPEAAGEAEAEAGGGLVGAAEVSSSGEATPETEPGAEAELESAGEADAAADVEAEAAAVVTEPEPQVTLVEPDWGSEFVPAPAVHAPGGLTIPGDVAVLVGEPEGLGRSVGVVVSRFNGEVTSRLLESALEELDRAGVARERITVMPVPGAFELPLGAMALAKTRRFACVVALGCVIRGETAHFDYVAGEAASGLQLAGLETGVPVAFGVLTVDTLEQAEARVARGADAARSALEMADIFHHLRAQAMSG